MHAILGVAMLAAGGWAVLRLARAGASGYRAGPWPGLTARGAALLAACAWLLLACDFLLGSPERALPDLVWLAVVEAGPPLLATCLVRAPGCASAVCGVYLLWRSLPSLVDPTIELPPLLLPPAVACDLAVWIDPQDVRPLTRRVWRRRSRAERSLTTWRGGAGGVSFGVVLALVEPPFALFLGSDPSGWQPGDRLLAGALAAVACAAVGAGIQVLTRRLVGP
jgi:hypothetical protein